MKLRPHILRSLSGILLMECMVWVFVFVIVVGFGTAAFFACWDNWKALRRNADDITRALNTGELWRTDIRRATAPVSVSANAGGQWLRIPTGEDEVLYAFTDGTVKRQAGSSAPWTVLLPKVTASAMTPDHRSRVKAWRWELELTPARRGNQLSPLFTFLAVPEANR